MRDEQIERLAEALRRCRVEDGSPAPLFREGDLRHIAYMIAPVVDAMVAEALREAADDWQFRLRRDAALYDYGRWLNAAAKMLRERADEIEER